MADTETATEETTETEEQPTEEQKSGQADDVEAMRKALKKANKEAENYRLKVKEFEDASKSEQERLGERVSTAEERANRAETDVLRLRVAIKKGIPADLADRLKGSTEEEMAADADSLLKVVKPNNGAGSFDAGAKESAPTGDDMNALIRRSVGRG